MNTMLRISTTITLSLIVLFSIILSKPVLANEPLTLIGSIVPWRYPEAKIHHPEMSDAATMNADGDRTVPSTLLKTTMMTPDSVDKVMAFYRNLLTRSEESDAQLDLHSEVGRSVVVQDESIGRAFSLHTILVNAANTSTTILITRAPSEKLTHIIWKQYVKHPIKE